MISCTEFIPLYSEFFKFLEEKGGHDAVVKYWLYISDHSIGDKSNPYSLISFMEREGGLDGAWSYWKRVVEEEACDVFRVYNKEKGYFRSHSRHCPSRGMLNKLEHVEPYYDYCEHCNVLYAPVLKKYGIVFERDHSKVANAECYSWAYLEGCRPNLDFIQDEQADVYEDSVIIDAKAEDNKYLHRDFHISGDLALKYCGDNYGENCVRSFLTTYANNYYAPQIEDAKTRGLIALKEWIERVYETEEASELLHTELTGDMLKITIDKSPAIAFMHEANQEPSKYYIEETRTVYSAIADACDFGFTMDYYNEDGGTTYRFFVRKYSE